MRLLATVIVLSCVAASAVEMRARGHASNITIHYGMQDVVSLHEPVVLTTIVANETPAASRAASLLQIITDSTNWDEVKEAAVELASIRDAVAVQPLGEAIAAQRGVDGISIDGLARIANDEAIQILRHATQSSDAGTASAAKTALRRLGKGQAQRSRRTPSYLHRLNSAKGMAAAIAW